MSPLAFVLYVCRPRGHRQRVRMDGYDLPLFLFGVPDGEGRAPAGAAVVNRQQIFRMIDYISVALEHT